MAKKTIEKPTMAVTTTVVESIEKPKKRASSKKRATVISRSADEVLGEIVNDTNETAKTEIRKASNKKVSTLRRISNKGEINLNDISDSELKEYITINIILKFIYSQINCIIIIIYSFYECPSFYSLSFVFKFLCEICL